MAYTTKDEVLLYLNRLQAEIEAGVEVPYLDIDELIDKADALINQYIGQIYTVPLSVPLDPRLQVINTISTLISAKWTWESWYAERQAADKPKPLDERWKWSIGMLEKIAIGAKGYELAGAELLGEKTGRANIVNSTQDADLKLSRTAWNSNSVLSSDW